MDQLSVELPPRLVVFHTPTFENWARKIAIPILPQVKEPEPWPDVRAPLPPGPGRDDQAGPSGSGGTGRDQPGGDSPPAKRSKPAGSSDPQAGGPSAPPPTASSLSASGGPGPTAPKQAKTRRGPVLEAHTCWKPPPGTWPPYPKAFPWDPVAPAKGEQFPWDPGTEPPEARPSIKDSLQDIASTVTAYARGTWTRGTAYCVQRARSLVTSVASTLSAALAALQHGCSWLQLQVFLLLMLAGWVSRPEAPSVTIRVPAGRRGKRRVGTPRTERVWTGAPPSILARLDAAGLGCFLLWSALTGALSRGLDWLRVVAPWVLLRLVRLLVARVLAALACVFLCLYAPVDRLATAAAAPRMRRLPWRVGWQWRKGAGGKRKTPGRRGRWEPVCVPTGPSVAVPGWGTLAWVLTALLLCTTAAASGVTLGQAFPRGLMPREAPLMGSTALVSQGYQEQQRAREEQHRQKEHRRQQRRARRHGLAACAAVSAFSPEADNYTAAYARYQKDPDGGWTWGCSRHLSQLQLAELQETVRAHKGTAFAYTTREMPGYHGGQGPFTLELTKKGPIAQPPRRYSPQEQAVIAEKTKELIDSGLAVEYSGPTECVVNPVLAAKKDEKTGQWTAHRMAQDYRPVNKHTAHDKYGLHRPEDIFAKVGKARIFSKLDMRQGFLQIPVAPEDQAKTAFWCGNKIIAYTRMPYGLKNASAKFQRVMDFEIAKAKLDHCSIAFIDDLLIWSETPEEHVRHVAAVLDMLHACGLRAHPDKSIFGADVLEYLGHNLSADGISPHQAKVSAILVMQPPRNLAELRSHLGFINYYRCYVPGMSTMAAPLNALLKKGTPWSWGPEQQAAFDSIKAVFAQEGIILRRMDYTRPFILHTDFSNKGMGAVLGQRDDNGNEYVCAAISRSLNVHEKNYSSYKGEMVAACWAIRTLRHHLLGGPPFELVTDHQPLTYLMTAEGLSGHYARMQLILQEFDFTIRHRPGAKHQNADSLSRSPLPTMEDNSGARCDHEPHDPVQAPQATLGAGGDAKAAASVSWQLSSAAAGACALAAAVHPVVKQVPACQSALVGAAREQFLANQAVCWATGVAAPSLSDLLPTSEELLLGNNGYWTDAADAEPAHEPPGVRQQQAALHQRATALLKTASMAPAGGKPGQVKGEAQLPRRFFRAAKSTGVTLLEPIGGSCAMLEACLRAGLRVSRYLVTQDQSQAEAYVAERLALLSGLYPHQFSPEAYRDAFTALPVPVARVTEAMLMDAGAGDGTQWLVGASWSARHPLEASQVNALHHVARVVLLLQQVQVRAPAFWVEWEEGAHEMQLGKQLPFVLEAERLGAAASRCGATSCRGPRGSRCCVALRRWHRSWLAWAPMLTIRPERSAGRCRHSTHHRSCLPRTALPSSRRCRALRPWPPCRCPSGRRSRATTRLRASWGRWRQRTVAAWSTLRRMWASLAFCWRLRWR